MSNSYISFYLKAYRIHVFTDTLRAIDSPKRLNPTVYPMMCIAEATVWK